MQPIKKIPCSHHVLKNRKKNSINFGVFPPVDQLFISDHTKSEKC